MVCRIISFLFFLFFNNQMIAQSYLGRGEISFFSEAPLENISAINKNVNTAYNDSSKNIVFQLRITDFVFPNPLMQEHFNENYLESDLYPNAFFKGIVTNVNNINAIAEGDLTIHGITQKIKVSGDFIKENNNINITTSFIVKLEDYNIDIPKIVMYKIAEEILVTINIDLKKIK